MSAAVTVLISSGVEHQYVSSRMKHVCRELRNEWNCMHAREQQTFVSVLLYNLNPITPYTLANSLDRPLMPYDVDEEDFGKSYKYRLPVWLTVFLMQTN